MAIKVTVGQTTFVKKIVVGTPIATAQTGISIDDFSDFSVATKSDGQILVYDSAETAFKNFTFDIGNGLAKEFTPGNDRLLIQIDSDKTPVVTGLSTKGHIVPTTDSTFDLGDSAKKFRDLYLSGGTIHLGNIDLKDSNGGFAATDSAGDPVNLNLQGSIQQIRNMFASGGDLSYNASTGIFEFDVEQVYTKENFDSDFNVTLDSAVLEGVGLNYSNATNTLNIDSSELSDFFRQDIRGYISGTDAGGDGSFSYNATTGVITYTGPSPAEVRAHFSAVDSGGDGAFSYESATGKFIYRGPSATEVRAHMAAVDAGGDGSFSYDSSTGAYTYTGPSAAEVRAHFSGGDGIGYNSGTGDIRLDSAELTNLYRQTIRGYISGTDAGGDGSFAYNATTGTFTYTGPSASEVRAHFSGGSGIAINSGDIKIDSSELTDFFRQHIRGFINAVDAGGDGSFAYDSALGKLTYTGPSASEVRAHFSAGEGIDISSGEISGEDATTSNKGIASFDTEHFSVTSGAVSIKADGIDDTHIDFGTGTNQVNTDDVPEGTTNLYYTDARADSAAKASLLAGTGVTYDSSTGVIAIGQPVATTDNVTFNQVRGPAEFIIDPATVGDNTGTVKILGNLQVEGTQTVINSTTVSINDKNIVLADSAADAAAADGAGITINGASATLNYSASGDKFVFNKPFEGQYLGFDSDFDSALTTKTTSNLAEGTNLYYTTARADSDAKASLLAIDAGGDGSFTYDSGTGVMTYTGPSASEVRAHFTGGSGIGLSSGDIKIDSSELYSLYKHDDFGDFVADEHVAHTGVSIIAGNGLTGGGNIASSRTINIDSANVRGMFSASGDLSYNSGTGQFSIDVEDVYTKENFDSDYVLAKDSANTAVERNQHIDSADFTVTVNSKTANHVYSGGSGNAYYIDGTESPILNLKIGRTYQFNLSSSDMSSHPFRFYYDAAKTTQYTTNVTTGSTFARILITESTPSVLHYQCSAHGYMGHALQIGTRNFTGFTTTNLSEGTNLYYTDTRFDNRLAAKTTDNLSEGSSNLYYTNARVQTFVDSAYVQARQLPSTDSAATQAMIDSNFINMAIDIHIPDGGSNHDSAKISFGNDSDLKIFHNGSHSVIQDAGTGSLLVQSNNFTVQNAAGTENQIQALSGGVVTLYHNNLSKLKTDSDGIRVPGIVNQASGIILEDPSNTAYGGHVTFYDGSATEHFGNGDIVIGGRSNGTRLKNIVLDRDIERVRFPGDVQFDSSSGIIFDVSDKRLKVNSSLYKIQLIDNATIKFGTGEDGEIKHTGSNFQFQNTTGDLQFSNFANDKDVDIRTDDGSGSTALYFKADGSTGKAILYYYGSQKLETSDSGVSVTGELTADSATIGGLRFPKSDGLNNQVIRTDGAGNLSFVSVAAISGAIDSAAVITLIDSAYVAARSSGGTDSAATQAMIDSNLANDITFGGKLALSSTSGPLIKTTANYSTSDISILQVSGDGTGGPGTFGFDVKYMGSRTGNNNSYSLFMHNQTGTDVEAMTVFQDGKVGINQVTPTSALHVGGAALFDDDVTFDSAGAVFFDKSHQSLNFGDHFRAKFGDSGDASIRWNANNLVLQTNTAGISLQPDTEANVWNGSAYIFRASKTNNKVELYANNTKRLETTDSGVNITGNIRVDNAPFTSGITVQEEGSSLSTAGTTLNFVGDNVTATGSGATKTITITGGSGVTGFINNVKADTFTGDASTTAFTLSNAPADSDDLMVFVNGVLQHTNTYSVSGTTLTLDSAPDSASDIETRTHLLQSASLVLRDHKSYVYTLDTTTDSVSGADSAGVTLAYDVGKVDVFANGSRLVTGKDFTATDGTSIVFDSSFSSGNVIEVVSHAKATTADLNGILSIDSDLTTTGANQIIHTYAAANHRTLKFTAQIEHDSSSSYHAEEVLLTHNGTSVAMTTYAQVLLDSNLGTFDADINSGNVRIKFSPTKTNTSIKLRAIRTPA